MQTSPPPLLPHTHVHMQDIKSYKYHDRESRQESCAELQFVQTLDSGHCVQRTHEEQTTRPCSRRQEEVIQTEYHI